eukprot:221993_1
MDDTLNTSQTSRPHRGRRPRRRKSRNRYCDDQKGDNIHVDDPSNSNSNTNNSLLDLDQLNIHTPNNVSANPQHSTPSFASTSTSQSELRIESYLTKQSNKKQEQVILRFKLTTEGTKLRLDVSENDKKMKPCTAPALDKYKKDVLMAVLAYYFNYSMYEQLVSILIDIRERAKYDETLNINGKFDLDFVSIFWKSSDTLLEYIGQVWTSLNKSWMTNPSETKMHEHYIGLQETVNEWDICQSMRQIFDSIESKNKWIRFVYGLNKTCYDYYIQLLREQLLVAAYKEASNKRTSSQNDSADKLYLIHGMGNATLNSMLRMYHGFNWTRNNKICLVTLTNNMLFKYKDLNEFLSNDKVPTRLKFENRGGLRIMDDRFVKYVGGIIDNVTPELQNVFVKYKGELQQLLDAVCNKSKNNDDFQKLFDMQDIQEKAESFVHNNYMDVDAKDTDTDTEEEEDDLEQLLQIALKRVENDLKRGVIVRCIWSYIKKLRPDQNTLTLRAKLQIYHMSDDKKYSSLQAT